MAIEDAMAFCAEVVEDKVFRTQFLAQLPDGTKYAPGEEQQLMEAITSVTGNFGLSFSVEELEAAVKATTRDLGKFKTVRFALTLQKELKEEMRSR